MVKSGDKWRQVLFWAVALNPMSTQQPTLYAGTFERSMDAKKRVAVPSDWLREKEKKEEFFALAHPKGQYVVVMPPEELEALGQKIESRDLAESQKRVMIRNLYAGAHKVVTDGQGRILLPEEHCAKAELKGTVKFVGGMGRFEVWSKERFEAYEAENQNSYLEVAEDIGL